MNNGLEKPRDDGLRTHKTYGPLHEERNYFYTIHKVIKVKATAKCWDKKSAQLKGRIIGYRVTDITRR